MRLNEAIIEYSRINSKKIKVIQQLNGGYERWFQLDLCHFLITNFSNVFTVTEADVYGTLERLDILVYQYGSISMGIEIKCQSEAQLRPDRYPGFITSIAQDCEKIKNAKNVPVKQVIVGCYENSIQSIIETLYQQGYLFKQITDTPVIVYSI